MRSTARSAFIATSGFLAAAALPRTARAQTAAKLIVGDTAHDASSWILALANSGGFYEREHLTVDFVYTGNNATTVQQLLAKSLDIAKASMETLIRADENGASLSMVATTMLPYPYSFMAAPAIVKPADLKGKRVMLDLPSSILSYTWSRWVRANGLAPDDVELVYDGSSPNRFAALVSGAVVAVPLNQPLDVMATIRGYRRLIAVSSTIKTVGFSCLMGRSDWLADGANGDVLRRFLRALARATDYFYDPKNRDAAVAALVAFAKIETPIAQQVYEYYTGSLRPYAKNAAIPDAWVKGNLDYLVESGVLKAPSPPVSKYLDRRFSPT